MASVWQGTGHEPGSGPLPANLPIVIDVWPCDEFFLGHGVGLRVHEEPNLARVGEAKLVASDAIAIEPSLWESGIGGVQLEDLLLATDDGTETLTRYPYELAP